MQFIVKYNAVVNKVSPETSLLDKSDLFLPVYLLSDLLLYLNKLLFISLLNIYFGFK